MKTQTTVADEEFPGLLDGLVCGELDETARGRVLAWLEQDPGRWRVCGLAFLEAQTWTQALGDSSPGVNKPSLSDRTGESCAPQAVGTRRSRVVRRSLVAAALLIAFGLGLALRDVVLPRPAPVDRPVAGTTSTSEGLPDRDTLAAPAGNEPVFAALDVQAGGRFGPSAPVRIPVVPAGTDAGVPGQAELDAEIPDYVRQQWERRGYKVSLERRFLFARLPDGQQVVVPVDQLHVDRIPVSIN